MISADDRLTRNPLTDPVCGDAVEKVYPPEVGAQAGAHWFQCGVTYARKLWLSHTWPDGCITTGWSTRAAWRMLVHGGTVRVQMPDPKPVFRERRGKVVEVPPEWVGVVTSDQTKNKRKREADTKPHDMPRAYVRRSSGHATTKPFRRTGRANANRDEIIEQELTDAPDSR